jgi:hypothetical protein
MRLGTSYETGRMFGESTQFDPQLPVRGTPSASEVRVMASKSSIGRS